MIPSRSPFLVCLLILQLGLLASGFLHVSALAKGSGRTAHPSTAHFAVNANANANAQPSTTTNTANSSVEEPESRAGLNLYWCTAEDCDRETVAEGVISFRSPATNQVLLQWEVPPKSVLVLVKPDEDLLNCAAQTIAFLQNDMNVKVYIEQAFIEPIKGAMEALPHWTGEGRERLHEFIPSGSTFHPELWDGKQGDTGSMVDVVVTLGGDGLLMHANTLFPQAVPPHMCINLGSMGFLTPFQIDHLRDELQRIFGGEEPIKINLRLRLSAQIMRKGEARDCESSVVYHALNEMVIDRGTSPYLSNLEVYCDDLHITTVQADGLIIATPTGSTAYSMSAGGSMVHPSVPAILLTPICPHSLSFRPIVFPDSVVLRCDVPDEARAEAWVSFDGKNTQPLRQGDSLVVQMSAFPVPTICSNDSTSDWFGSLGGAFGFNRRTSQKPFDIERFFSKSRIPKGNATGEME
ncbi:unnamed protein product [Chrysoparadoxa australica]